MLRPIAQHSSDQPMVRDDEQSSGSQLQAKVRAEFLRPLLELLVQASLVHLQRIADQRQALRPGKIRVAAQYRLAFG
jgi:hypothetical protein